ncbi:nuclear transport factor 2 family protein [Sorangium sp. So ce1128]
MNSRPYELYVSLDDLAPLWRVVTGWDNEATLRAALVSLELYFLLIADSAQDLRPAARREERITRLWSAAAGQLRMLGDLLAPTPPPVDLVAERESRASNLRALRALDGSALAPAAPARLLRQFTDGYAATLESCPFLLGLEPEINRLCSSRGIRGASFRPGAQALPYDTWATPEAVAELFYRRGFNAEDRLFASTHQSVECWMFLILRSLASADERAQRLDFHGAAQSITQAAAIVSHVSEAITILETMVLSDYHPLRVRLRDASGAQSTQVAAALAASRRLPASLAADLESQGASYLLIFRRPNEFPAEHAFLEALATLEARWAGFLFSHYKLAVRVLGMESMGSLGVEVQALINHFVKPLYPEMDEARYKHGVLTSFAHGRHAGNLISDLERAPRAAPRLPEALEEARIRSVIEAYFEAMREMDLDRWVGLFSGNGMIEAPAGSRPFRGHHGLRTFFRGFMKVFEREVSVTVLCVRVEAARGRAEVDWRTDVRHKGIPISYTGTECFDFAASGEIVRVTVREDPRDIARQMLAGPEGAGYPLEGEPCCERPVLLQSGPNAREFHDTQEIWI